MSITAEVLREFAEAAERPAKLQRKGIVEAWGGGGASGSRVDRIWSDYLSNGEYGYLLGHGPHTSQPGAMSTVWFAWEAD